MTGSMVRVGIALYCIALLLADSLWVEEEVSVIWQLCNKGTGRYSGRIAIQTCGHVLLSAVASKKHLPEQAKIYASCLWPSPKLQAIQVCQSDVVRCAI